MLTVDELRSAVALGQVDTVLVAFVDMHGRLQGKRFHARYFVDEVLEHGTEACNYLLAVDVDMTPADGYAMSSWDAGYGDFVLEPDLSTLRSRSEEHTSELQSDVCSSDLERNVV